MAPLSALLLALSLSVSAFVAYRVALLACSVVEAKDLSMLVGAGARELLMLQVCRFPRLKKTLESFRKRQRFRALKYEMPEAVRLMCIALDSGSSLVHAIDYAASNCREPLAAELKQAVWDLRAGQAFDEAMERLRDRTGGSEFAYLAVAMEIQHQSGGSLKHVLETVSASLQQSIELDEQLATKTSQGRLSARIVALMPLVLGIALSFFSPGYFSLFVSTSLGLFLLVFAVILEAAGIVLVRRALSVDLSSHLEGGV